MRVVVLAKFTLKSYLQEKILLVVMIFAGLLMLSSYVLSPLAVGAQQKIVIDIGLAAISIFAVALIVLLGAGSFHIEKSAGGPVTLLAKPICASSSCSAIRGHGGHGVHHGGADGIGPHAGDLLEPCEVTNNMRRRCT
jgi:hypothetical protein